LSKFKTNPLIFFIFRTWFISQVNSALPESDISGKNNVSEYAKATGRGQKNKSKEETQNCLGWE